MLAGLPSGAAPWPAYVLFVIPPAAGVLAGMITLRRLARPPRLRAAALYGLAIAGGIGVMAAIAAAVSGGSVTSGRFETIGPSALPVGAFAALEVGVPAFLTVVALAFYRAHWLHRPSPADRGSLGERTRALAGVTAGSLARPLRRLRRGRDATSDVIDLTEVIDLTGLGIPDDSGEPETELPLDAQDTQPLDLSGLAELVRQAEEGSKREADPEAEPEPEPVAESESEMEPEHPRRRLPRLLRRKKTAEAELPE
jgi:hypothetical protein